MNIFEKLNSLGELDKLACRDCGTETGLYLETYNKFYACRACLEKANYSDAFETNGEYLKWLEEEEIENDN